MDPAKALPKWEPQFSVKVRIPNSARDPEAITRMIVGRLRPTYGDPRVRKLRSCDTWTITWEGLHFTEGSGVGVLALVAEAMRLCDWVTCMVYHYQPPIREIPKRIIRQREDQYIAMWKGGNPPPEGMWNFIFRAEDQS